MQAIICREKNDPDCDDLLTYLHDKEIKFYIINSLTDIISCLKQLDQNKPFLLYRNAFERIECPELILKFHEENPNFDSLIIDGERVTYFPRQVRLLRDIVVTERMMLDFDSPYFSVSNLHKTLKRPITDPVHIFVLAFQRHIYFELSLNSLLYSFDLSVPVTIFLNGSSPQVKDIALRKAAIFPQIDIVEVTNNCNHAVVTLAALWTKAKKFLIWEDDFILPPIAKTLFPFWPYQFAHRLNKFDLVGWSVITENIPEWHTTLGNFFPRKDYAFYDWVYGGNIPFGGGNGIPPYLASTTKPMILGQALATHLDFYKSCISGPPWYGTTDYSLLKKANDYCLPGLRGYHIGWNQQMDGLGNHNKKSLKEAPLTNTLESIITGRKETYNLAEDVKNL